MINIDKYFISNSINLLYIQSIEIIQQNLENYDEWIFKNYKIDETLK
ncbi:hypothetical protein [Spiroplasma endosymbiont of Phyllotreta cruciferae]|nr:hypothetical protein [Spiroplasma endosymbiont of Phyllotreta cruciferae]